MGTGILIRLVIAAVLQVVAGSQGTTTVRGTLLMSDGSSVPGAMITLRHQATGRVFTSTTDAEGAFSIPDVPYGDATLRAEVQGFRQIDREIEVTPGRTAVIALVLPVPIITETVTVSTGTSGTRSSPPPPPPPPAVGLRWNAWMERAPGGSFNVVSHLRPGDEYSLAVHLSGIDYSPSGSGVRTEPAGLELGRWLDQHPEEAEAHLTVLMVLDSRAFTAAQTESADSIRVSLKQLRAFMSDTENFNVPADPIAELKANPDASFVFGRTRFRVAVNPRFEGLAGIALSVWDGMRPLDEVVFSFCVAPDARARKCSRSSPIAESLKGIDAPRLAVNTDPSYPDLALHFIEFPGRRVVGVLRQHDWAVTDAVTWPLQVNVSQLQTRLKTMARDLGEAFDEKEHRVTGDALYGLLFPLPEAAKARHALEAYFDRFATSAPFASLTPPTFFVRPILADAENGPFIPLAYLFLPRLQTFIGYHVLTLSPLPVQSYDASPLCIDRWVLLVPSKVGDQQLQQAFLALTDKRAIWKAARAQVYDDIPGFSKWIGEFEQDATPSVIAVLSHQEEDRLRFDRNSYVYAENMHRTLTRSVAILSACETAPPVSGALVRKLNRNGVVAMIATSSKVRPELGGSMLRELASVIETGDREDAEPIALLFRRAQAQAWKEIQLDDRARSSVLKYMLVGNGAVRICRPAPVSAQ